MHHMSRTALPAKFVANAAVTLALVCLSASAQANGYSVLYAFQGGNDGAWPIAGLVRSSGDLYGTTSAGGSTGCGGAGCGTIFRLRGNKEAVIHSFTGGNDGAYPYAALIADSNGNLFGTTYQGGSASCSVYGCGTIFEVTPDDGETILYSFKGGNDGAYPYASLTIDAAGNLYGTTAWGGAYGKGTVFELAPDGTETVLHAFVSSDDGRHPYGGVVVDSEGNLYGTTYRGGGHSVGSVFELAPDGTESFLHRFRTKNDGTNPYSAMIMDNEGNLYGTTVEGGSLNCTGSGCGTIFRIKPDGTETIYPLKGPSGGSQPFGGVLLDGTGYFFGTANGGGSSGLGVVFRMSSAGAERVLHNFAGGQDGSYPYGGVVMDKKGDLYGTTTFGGNGAGCANTGCGVVFEVSR